MYTALCTESPMMTTNWLCSSCRTSHDRRWAMVAVGRPDASLLPFLGKVGGERRGKAETHGRNGVCACSPFFSGRGAPGQRGEARQRVGVLKFSSAKADFDPGVTSDPRILLCGAQAPPSGGEAQNPRGNWRCCTAESLLSQRILAFFLVTVRLRRYYSAILGSSNLMLSFCFTCVSE